MPLQTLPYFLMAMLAYSCISVGFVMMKHGIGWIGWVGEKSAVFYRQLAIWIGGFFIMNIYGIPSALALKGLPSHIVAAFAGWGIIILVFLSHVILGEIVYASDIVYSAIIVMGVISLSIYEPINSREEFQLLGLIVFTGLPIIFIFFGFWQRLSKKFSSLIFGIASGTSAGLMVIWLRLLVVNYKFNILLYFQSPFLYAYILFALISFFTLQLALKNGAMIVVGPAQYSANIIYPLVVTVFIFEQPVRFFTLLSIVAIVIAVNGMVRKDRDKYTAVI